ncbi:MAG: hypothetical protein KDA21_09780 [Phycisphaerales bacterium]|nr:hypothetical protein [Phycisphaerales bacterium]
MRLRRLARPLRKSMMLGLCLVCLLGAATIFLLYVDRERLVEASTAELCTLLGFLLLPVLTLGLIELDRRACQS